MNASLHPRMHPEHARWRTWAADLRDKGSATAKLLCLLIDHIEPHHWLSSRLSSTEIGTIQQVVGALILQGYPPPPALPPS